MKSKLCLLIAGTLMASLLAGCGDAAAASREESAPEQTPDHAAEMVYGKIKEINGNEILLAIGAMGRGENPGGSFSRPEGEALDREGQPPWGDGERPSFPEGERPNRGNGQRPALEEGEQPSFPEGMDPEGGDGQTPSPDSGDADGQESAPPSRGPGQRAGGRGAAGAGQGSGLEQETFALTGEEKTYLIPVTAKITAKQGETTTELRFTQLAVKNVICLYLDSAGEIVSVELLQ